MRKISNDFHNPSQESFDIFQLIILIINVDGNFQPKMPPRRRRISDLRMTPVSTAWRQAGIRCSKTIEHNIRRLCTDICETMSHLRWHEGEFRAPRRTIATTSRQTERAIIIDTIDGITSNSCALKACRISSGIWNRDETLINGHVVEYTVHHCRPRYFDSYKKA